MSDRTAYKDYFDAEAAERLAKQIERVYPKLNKRRFKQQCTRDLDELEFHDRVKQFSAALRDNLPESVDDALELLTESLPEPLPDCERVTDGWLQWPIGQFIADFGTPHFETAFKAMIELTQRFTSEFAVRPFVELYPDKTFRKLGQLASHDNAHVRRWCSEGVRPRLPWGRKLKQLVHDPEPVFPILERLKDDPELYVRRSVANNLNDIAKDHPRRVVACCRSWSAGSDEREWVVRHALRTLVKDGDPGALELVGFSPPQKIELSLEITPKRITIGKDLTLRAELFNGSKHTQKVLLDFVVHYVRKNGSRTEKVFKWKSLDLPSGETLSLQKKLPMRETTVRALYPGKHLVEGQINGTRMASASFQLKQP